jgi:hypothetical protein
MKNYCSLFFLLLILSNVCFCQTKTEYSESIEGEGYHIKLTEKKSGFFELIYQKINKNEFNNELYLFQPNCLIIPEIESIQKDSNFIMIIKKQKYSHFYLLHLEKGKIFKLKDINTLKIQLLCHTKLPCKISFIPKYINNEYLFYNFNGTYENCNACGFRYELNGKILNGSFAIIEAEAIKILKL